MRRRDHPLRNRASETGSTAGIGSNHLTAESLARLVDEPPSGREKTHLERCESCRDELEALVRQTRVLGTLPDPAPPEGEWEAIGARLTLDASGRVVGASRPEPGAVADRSTRVRAPWSVAAGLVLFLGGGAVGALLAGGVSRPADPVTSGPNDPNASVATVGAAADPAPPGRAALPDISSVVWRDDMPLAESEAWVRRTQRWHLDALTAHRTRIEEAPGIRSDADPLSRLVLTENILAATEAAVRQAPTDPFFNGLLVSTEAERRAVFTSVRDAVTRTRRESP